MLNVELCKTNLSEETIVEETARRIEKVAKRNRILEQENIDYYSYAKEMVLKTLAGDPQYLSMCYSASNTNEESEKKQELSKFWGEKGIYYRDLNVCKMYLNVLKFQALEKTDEDIPAFMLEKILYCERAMLISGGNNSDERIASLLGGLLKKYDANEYPASYGYRVLHIDPKGSYSYLRSLQLESIKIWDISTYFYISLLHS